MLKKIFILFLFVLSLNAFELQQKYYVNTNLIHISDILRDTKDNTLIYRIEKTRYSKRVKSKEVIELLKKMGYKATSKHRYINFIKKSHFKKEKIKKFIEEYYKKNYLDIKIDSIDVQPRGYITKLPKKYTIEIKSKNYLFKKGILNIKTPQNRKLFFNYTVDAKVDVYISRKKIKKDTELSDLNLIKKSIILNKFTSKPIQELKPHTLEAKHSIKVNKVITLRDVKPLSLVKRNSFVSVSLKSNNMFITFSARALQNGKLGDVIRVEKNNKKRLKVIVVGKNRVEMR